MASYGLLGGLSLSLIHLSVSTYRNRQKNGSIQLTDSQADDLPTFASSARAEPAQELEQSGQPVEPEAFWSSVRKRKIGVLLAAGALLALACFRIGWDVVNVRNDEQSLKMALPDATDALLFLYITGLAGAHVKTQSRHWTLILHLTTLLFLALASLSLSYAPASVIDPTLLRGDSSAPSFVLPLQLAFTAAAFLLVGTMKKGPPLILKRKRLASPLDQEWREPTEPNVSELEQESALGQLFFTWSTRLLMFGHNKSQLGQEDLPFLPANLRASNLFIGLKAKPSHYGLAWQLLSANASAVTIQCTLAAVTAVQYYAPAFFLNRIIQYLERDADARPPQAVALTYALSLFAVLVADAIITGQMWLISSATLASRVRMQLNTLVFEKVLRRKDFTGAAVEEEDEDHDEGANPSAPRKKASSDGASSSSDVEESEAFNSKNQCLTVFSVDVDRVAEFTTWSFSLIDAPLEMLIGCIFLYNLLGWAGLFGVAASIAFLPLNHFASTAFATTQRRLMAARDRRVSLMSEVLSSVRMIKFMAWERSFESRINGVREQELRAQKQQFALEVVFDLLWAISPVVCIVVAFFLYTKVQGQELTPSKAFASLAVFNELRFALNALPDVFVSGLESLVSLRRIEKFLAQPEIQLPHPVMQPPASVISLRSATVRWPVATTGADSSDGERSLPQTPRTGASTPFGGTFALRDVSVDFVPGELNLICGPLGSGKTLLIQSLLGEADVLTGQVICPRSSPDGIFTFAEDHSVLTRDTWVVPGQVAYVPQAAWLQNASIRSNILFGLPMDQQRYDSTLEACSLTKDLAALDDGDQTEIGERGIGLSGGQKHRVSLARAVYSRAGVLLLDDVLSAVDAHTAHHIYTHCLLGPLLKGRTVLLVSHHAQLILGGCKHITLLENGGLQWAGSRDDFMDSEYASKYVTQEEEEAQDRGNYPPAKKLASKPVNKTIQRVQQSTAGDSSDSSEPSSEESDSESEEEDELSGARKPRKLVLAEQRAVGSISWDVWTSYVKSAGSWLFWLLAIIIFVGAQVFTVAEAGWLAKWSRSYTDVSERQQAHISFLRAAWSPVLASANSQQHHTIGYWLTIYATLTTTTVLFGALRYLVIYDGAIRASRRLHSSMLRSIFRAPLSLFDRTALGTMVNRFAKDLETVDSQTADHVTKTSIYLLGVLTTVAAVTWTIPIFFVGFMAVTIGYIYFARLYVHTARELRRLDAVTKSPLFALYSETISGTNVLRAFGASSLFMATCFQRIDQNLTFFFNLWGANRWLSVRFSLLSAFAALLSAVVLIRSTTLDASLAGFALSFVLNISSDVIYLVRRWTALELAMVSVERVKEYSELEQEAPEIVEPRPPAAWPHQGQIDIERLCVRYAPDLPLVLDNISLNIKGGEKIGVVGATGCGKSTLALSFFRFVEPFSGSITIDGLDIGNMGLRDLRSRLSIIPQDPVIFSGTLREALDVFGEHTDAEIFEALKRVHLLPEVKPTPVDPEEELNANPFEDLETPVQENGGNFSQGQRQLICMARAVLQRNKILLMDEATSSVDYETDEKISTTIAREFAGQTLLVIAHRLRTIITFDRVLVLHEGKVLEFEKPSTLLANESSSFFKLCAASGRRELKILKKMAEGGKAKAGVVPRRKTVRRASQKALT